LNQRFNILDKIRGTVELFGIALLPDVETRQRIVEFRESQQSNVGGPMLGMSTNLPHVTILQCPYFPDAPHAKSLDAVIEAVSLRSMQARFATLEYQHVGWVFADVKPEPWMARLQDACLEATLPFIDTAAINAAESFIGYTAAEQKNYLDYGYRYVGTSFRPHVTLGRSVDPEAVTLPPSLVEAFSGELGGSELTFSELVFYRAGEYGALAEVMEIVTLGS
jgi:2'-5' RNA ligase